MSLVSPLPLPTSSQVDVDLDAVDLDAVDLDELVDLARAGDAEAFGLLFHATHTHVYRFLLRFTRSEALAEDLTAESYLRALRRVRDFHGDGSAFVSWVVVIARNLALDHFGSGRHRLELHREDLEVYGVPTPGSDSTVVASCTRKQILDALQEVPELQREVVIGRFLQDLSIAELAHRLGRSEGAVKQLQWRGLRSLSRRLPADVRH